MFNMKTPAELRGEKNVSREDVSKAVGLSIQGYTNVELGNRYPSFKAAKKIAKYFGVPVESIRFGNEIKNNLSPFIPTGTECCRS